MKENLKGRKKARGEAYYRSSERKNMRKIQCSTSSNSNLELAHFWGGN